MHLTRLVVRFICFASFLIPVVAEAQRDSLQVLHVSGGDTVHYRTPITITFDRPIAMVTESLPDPETIVRLTPRVPGKLRWRSPVSIRFMPDSAWVGGQTYRMMVSGALRSADGASLGAPYVHTFTGAGARLVSVPAAQHDSVYEGWFSARSPVQIVYDSWVDSALVARSVRVELEPSCVVSRSPEVRVIRARKWTGGDPWNYSRVSQQWSPRTESSFTYALAPQELLPFNCAGTLVVPQAFQGTHAGAFRRIPFRTYPPLAITRVACVSSAKECPRGPFEVTLSQPTPARELLHQHLHVTRQGKPVDSLDVVENSYQATRSMSWIVEGDFQARTEYLFTLDTLARDAEGRNVAPIGVTYTTLAQKPALTYAGGQFVVRPRERMTLPARYVNMSMINVEITPYADSDRAEVLRNREEGRPAAARKWIRPCGSVISYSMRMRVVPDSVMTENVPLDLPSGACGGKMVVVRISGAENTNVVPDIIVHRTALAADVRASGDGGSILVTRLGSGEPVRNAVVQVISEKGQTLTARTGADGMARLLGLDTLLAHASPSEIAVFQVRTAMDDLIGVWPQRTPARFVRTDIWTDRAIYRPGDSVHAIFIARWGTLDRLQLPSNDSVQWEMRRNGETVFRATSATNQFGAATWSTKLPSQGATGFYEVAVSGGGYDASRDFRVEEYRAPSFLVSVTPRDTSIIAGDTAHLDLSARYLFDAPVAQAPTKWYVVLDGESPPPAIATLYGYTVGSVFLRRAWRSTSGTETLQGDVVLDSTGMVRLDVAIPVDSQGVARQATVVTDVTDPTHQHINGRARFVVHPAAFYIGVRLAGPARWQAGETRSVEVLAATTEGALFASAAVDISIVRRHTEMRFRDTDSAKTIVIEDAIARCRVVTALTPVYCRVRADSEGTYSVRAVAHDASARRTVTELPVIVVPKMTRKNHLADSLAVTLPDKAYRVGDTADVMVRSSIPTFALVTVEGERVLRSRTVRLRRGATIVPVVIETSMIPHFDVTVTARDTAGAYRMAQGGADVSLVTKLALVTVHVPPREIHPRDTLELAVTTRPAGSGAIGSSLWAVDEGVLALTDFAIPAPLEDMYARNYGTVLAAHSPRMLPRRAPELDPPLRIFGYGVSQSGSHLRLRGVSSYLSGVVTSEYERLSINTEPAGFVRKNFAATAFFLGSLAADSEGVARARVTMPDNLTTFRVIALSTAGADRFGVGSASLVVTQPLLARPALPRFVRPGDAFTAGAVVTSRVGALRHTEITTSTSPPVLEGDTLRSIRATPGGTLARFSYRVPRDIDSLRVQYTVRADTLADAVSLTLPVRPDYQPRAHTAVGIVQDSGAVTIVLPPETDPSRTTLTVHIGASPLQALSAAREVFLQYPYDCTEQLSSTIRALTVLRTRGDTSRVVLDRIVSAVAKIVARQNDAGGFGYWDRSDRTNPGLTAYAGNALLDARIAGIPVNNDVIHKAFEYLVTRVNERYVDSVAAVRRVDSRAAVAPLENAMDVVEYFIRLGRTPLIGRAGDSLMVALIRHRAMLQWADQVRLATIIVRAYPSDTGAQTIIRNAVGLLKLEGNRATLPDSTAGVWMFPSFVRQYAWLLEGLAATNPHHPMLVPLLETVLRGGQELSPCNTFDWSQAVVSVSAATGTTDSLSRPRDVRIVSGNILLWDGQHPPTAAAIAIERVLRQTNTGFILPLQILGKGRVYYVLTALEVPTRQPVRPDDAGMVVQRRYERVSDGASVTSVRAGEIVRVHLTVTAPRARQFVVLDDPLPAGLEVIDPSLRTTVPIRLRPSALDDNPDDSPDENETSDAARRTTGGWIWDGNRYRWTVWEHRELRDDRVIFAARQLWGGSYTASYLARATTSGTFIRPTAQAEEMYNPALHGWSDGGVFVVSEAPSR